MIIDEFQNSKEPLFGRATAQVNLKSFDIQTTIEIFQDYSPNYKNEDLLAFYLSYGGVVKCVEYLSETNAFTRKRILDQVFSDIGRYRDSKGENENDIIAVNEMEKRLCFL